MGRPPDCSCFCEQEAPQGIFFEKYFRSTSEPTFPYTHYYYPAHETSSGTVFDLYYHEFVVSGVGSGYLLGEFLPLPTTGYYNITTHSVSVPRESGSAPDPGYSWSPSGWYIKNENSVDAFYESTEYPSSGVLTVLVSGDQIRILPTYLASPVLP